MENGGRLAATINHLSLESACREAADLVEFRLDKAETPIEQLETYRGELPIIATNRGAVGSIDRIDTLLAASQFDAVEMVDLELETLRTEDSLVGEFRANDVELIVSHHDFLTTPDRDELRRRFDECAVHGDIAKVATTPQDTSDTVRLLDAVDSATRDGLVVSGIAMGEIGSHTRVVGHLYGSKLGYAPLEGDDTEYAPGQIPLHALASLIEDIDRWSGRDGEPE